MPDVNIGEFLRLGGVYRGIQGESPVEAFKSICQTVNLPAGVSGQQLYEALCARESVLSTAVGNGIAIPHSQQPLAKSFADQRVYICYLENPINMKALDNKRVHTMIVPVSFSVQSHLHIISRLAQLLTKTDFRKALELKYDLNELYPLIRQL